MQKDTHKVKSYKFVCKVPPQCSHVLTKTHKKKTHNAQNECKFFSGGIFNVYLNTPRDLCYTYCTPLHCGGTPTMKITPAMSNCTYFLLHNVAIVRSHTHTHTHEHTNTHTHTHSLTHTHTYTHTHTHTHEHTYTHTHTHTHTHTDTDTQLMLLLAKQ